MQEYDGSVSVAGDLHVGAHDTGNGFYGLESYDSSYLTVGGSEYIGDAFGDTHATGAFYQNGGMYTVGNQLHVGDQATGSGSYEIHHGTLTATNGITVGQVGTFTQYNGTVDLSNGGGFGDLVVIGKYTLLDTYVSDGSFLNVAHTEYIGAPTGAGAAEFDQDGGDNTVTGNLALARYAGTHATYTMAGGTLTAANVYVAGDTDAAGGTATLTISDGAVASIGKKADGTYTGTVHIWQGGTFNINTGGTLNTGTMINDGVINNGGGTYSYSGTISGSGVINQTAGTGNIASGTTLDSGSLQIGGGTTSGSGNLLIATDAGANGNLAITGGSTTINGTLGVGNGGALSSGSSSANGSVSVSAGSLKAGVIILGNSLGSGGSLFVSSTGFANASGLAFNDATISGGSLTIGTDAAPDGTDSEIANSMVGGYQRNGALNVNGGTVTSPTIKLGITAGNTGTFTQTAGTVNVGVLGAGNDATMTTGQGTGTVNISGGVLNADTVLLGNNSGQGGGDMTVSGTGQVNVSGGFSMNDLNVKGGSVTVADQRTAGNYPAGEDAVLHDAIVGGYQHNGAMNLSDGTVTVPLIKLGITAGKTGTVNQTGGTLNVDILGVGNDSTLTGGAGIGIANLTGGTTNANTIVVGSSAGGVGYLKVNSGAAVTATHGATISSGSQFTGNGTFNGDVTNNGHLDPGDTLGALTINGHVSMGATALLDIDLGGTGQGNTYDLLHGSQDIVLGGRLYVGFANGFESTITSDETFTIVTGDSAISGSFLNVASGSRLLTNDGHGEFTVTYSDGHDVVLSDFAAVVPEPGSISLLAVGASLLLRRQRRRGSLRSLAAPLGAN